VSEGPLIATIEEQITATNTGLFCLILLLFSQFAMFFAFTFANGAIQWAAIGTVWIATNILLTEHYRVSQPSRARSGGLLVRANTIKVPRGLVPWGWPAAINIEQTPPPLSTCILARERR
jgi:hypothetical protein